MGKTSKQTQTVKLPPELQAAAQRNLQLAGQVGALPAMNNFGPTVAAANPMQVDAMRQTGQAADAFGLGSRNGLGLPDAVRTPGGYAGYSTKPVYDAAMGGLSQVQRDLLSQFTYNPNTGAPPANPSIGASDLLGVLGGQPQGQGSGTGSGAGSGTGSGAGSGTGSGAGSGTGSGAGSGKGGIINAAARGPSDANYNRINQAFR